MYNLTFGKNAHLSKKKETKKTMCFSCPMLLIKTNILLINVNILIKLNITNFMGHNLAIIVMHIFFHKMGSYGKDTDVIHLFVLFEHWCHMHYLDTNAMCLFILFKHRCCVFICVVHTRKSCTQLPFLNNAWYEPMKPINLWWTFLKTTICCNLDTKFNPQINSKCKGWGIKNRW